MTRFPRIVAFSCIGLLGIALAIPALALPSLGWGDDDDDKGRAGEHGALEQAMHRFEDHLRFLRRSLKEPAQDEQSLEHIWQAEQDALAAKALVPEMAAAIAEAERAAFVTDYRKEMVKLVAAMLELEAAFLSGDREATQAAYKAVKALEKPAHERFRVEEEDH